MPRPPIKFLQDPDRYLLAVAAAFPDLGTSRRGAVEIAVAAIEGYAVGPNRRPGWGRGLNLLLRRVPHAVRAGQGRHHPQSLARAPPQDEAGRRRPCGRTLAGGNVPGPTAGALGTRAR